jgi:hypothetical protein
MCIITRQRYPTILYIHIFSTRFYRWRSLKWRELTVEISIPCFSTETLLVRYHHIHFVCSSILITSGILKLFSVLNVKSEYGDTVLIVFLLKNTGSIFPLSILVTLMISTWCLHIYFICLVNGICHGPLNKTDWPCSWSVDRWPITRQRYPKTSLSRLVLYNLWIFSVDTRLVYHDTRCYMI